MGNYQFMDNWVSWLRESVRRNADVALTANTTFPMNKITEESIEPPEPARKYEEKRVLGSGRNVSDIFHMGYEPMEKAIPMNMQTGELIYFVLGSATMVGTAYDPAVTGAITGGGGTTSIATNVTATLNQYAGKIVQITNGASSGFSYYIVSNTASATATFVLDVAAPSGTPTIEIKKEPYTHTVAEANTLPSLALHFEQGLTSEDIIKDVLGCVVKSLKISVERNGVVKIEPTFIGAKSVTGNDSTKPTNLADEVFTFPDIVTASYVFTYNTGTVLALTEMDSLEITIENELEYLNTMGDEWPNKLVIKGRSYSIKMTGKVQNDTMYTLRYHTKVPSIAAQYGTTGFYATALALTVRIGRSATDYVELVFNKLYVAEYPNKLITAEKGELDIEAELRLAPEGICVVTAKDQYDQRRWEGSAAL